jgi:PAS domain S-box-containing protein
MRTVRRINANRSSKAGKKSLHKSTDVEKKYKTLFEQSPYGILLIDTEGRILDFNETAHRDHGFTREEFANLTIADIDPVESTADVKARISRILEKGRAEFETRHRTKQGEIRDFHVITRAIILSGQTLLHSIWRDITDRKRAEDAVRKNENKFRTLFNSVNDSILIHDLEGRFLEVNEVICRLLGYNREEILSMSPKDIDTPEAAKKVPANIENIMQKGEHQFESEQMTGDGRRIPVDVSARVIDFEGKSAIISVCRDITERKLAEEKVRQSEERYRSLFEDSPISLWEEDISDLQEHFNTLRSSGITDFRAYFADHPEEVYKCIGLIKIISVNKATLGLYEARDQVTLLQDLSRVFTAQSFESFREILGALAEGMWTYECEAVNQTLAGRKINVLLRWSLLPRTADQGSRALISIVDITDRKEAEEKLRRNEEFIRSILDTVDEGFIVIDRDLRILTANNAYCSQVGESCDAVIGRHCYEISHKTLRPCYEEGEECAVRHVFETGEPHTALHKHPDAKGSILYVETKAFPIKDRTGAVTSVIETVNNITERHLLEKEQLKTQKLEAIGTLAGGIAHDFNNLLQGVFGYISMAKLAYDDKQRSLTMLEQAEKALHMSVSLTTQLLTFSKGGRPVKEKIQLKSVIENSVRFALSGSNVDFRIKFDDNLWAVDGDEGQIGQVIQNIMLNADQAMPAGGTIAIAARNVHAPHKGLPVLLAEGQYVEISVKDNGIGIPEQYVPRLFDPYFTTKEKGSGLGLATSYSIIKNHGGLIDVKSKPGEGTTFFVYLPARETAEAKAETPPASVPPIRKGRILLMDDEEIIRNIAAEMIRSLGHEVELAENGKEAIEKYRESMKTGKKFDVVIMDLTIRGGMGGEDALKELLEIAPDIMAIVSSGYSDSSVISEYKTIGFKACLTKPYDIDSLNSALNSLMD